MTLTTSQATMIQNYVYSGGNLIAFKPDSKLAPIFGLTPLGSTTSEGYIKVNNSTDIGAGIVDQTMQFHGSADNYNPGLSSVIATLYSNSVTSTGFPAVTTYHIGNGTTVFFAYDLPKTIVYLRQGNPANANQLLDGDFYIPC